MKLLELAGIVGAFSVLLWLVGVWLWKCNK